MTSRRRSAACWAGRTDGQCRKALRPADNPIPSPTISMVLPVPVGPLMIARSVVDSQGSSKSGDGRSRVSQSLRVSGGSAMVALPLLLRT